ncbi:MAG: TVP38/TMEM64 family protein [Desulfitobacteriaceae bacterium]|nr:TVP38/TMEM64 family protein [Desulfitobacteriaceae bacterium]MDD4346923.1 TVP38/TMEM64 family protein [Desulfitobacteriaceae bacterium]MDD4401951.1 TVP38/TMEM64 family protein [Desulfitobacteriaceae bacterium]
MILSKKKLNSLLTLLFSLVLIIYLYPRLQDPAALQMFLANLGWKSYLLNLLIVAMQMLFPVVPFPLLAGLNSVLFGWVPGFLLSLGGSLMGCSLGFWLARSLGHEWIQKQITKSYILGKMASIPPRKSLFLIILARLTPICPAAAVNYIAGLSTMKFRIFFLGSFLGKLPMIAWESWVGHYFWQISSDPDNPKRFIIALVIGALVFSGIWLVYRLSEKRQQETE